jgi:Spy/CpxP family protein refolding chaperone
VSATAFIVTLHSSSSSRHLAATLTAIFEGAGRGGDWRPKESEMSETQQDRSEPTSRPASRRRWLWVGGGVLAGLAILLTLVPRASAFRYLAAPRGHGFSHEGFGGRGLHDPAQAKRRLGFAIEFALRGVNASEEQRQQVKRVMERTIDQLVPLAEKHRQHKHAMARELAKPEIDRAAIERLRKEGIAMADEASKTLAAAVTEAAEVLTPEQRAELIELAHRFHGEESAS